MDTAVNCVMKVDIYALKDEAPERTLFLRFGT